MANQWFRNVAKILIAVLLFGMLPLAGFMPGKAEAYGPPKQCDTVIESVYVAVYGDAGIGANCAVLSDDVVNLDGIGESSGVTNYEITITGSNRKGETFKIVDENGGLLSAATIGTLDSVTGAGKLQNVPIGVEQVVFAVLGDLDPDVVPIGRFEYNHKLAQVEPCERISGICSIPLKQYKLHSVNMNGQAQSIMRPVEGYYYFTADTLFGAFDMVFEGTENGTKSYYLVQDFIGETGYRVKESITVPFFEKDWLNVKTNVGLISESSSNVTSLKHRISPSFYGGAEYYYFDIDHPTSELNQPIQYYMDAETADMYRAFSEYYEIETPNNEYLLVNPLLVFQQEPVTTPVMINDSGLKEILFTEANPVEAPVEEPMEFSVIWMPQNHVIDPYMANRITVNLDAGKTFHFSAIAKPFSLRYTVNEYKFYRQPEILMDQTGDSASTTLIVGAKANKVDAGEIIQGYSDYSDFLPRLRTPYGDELQNLDSSAGFELFKNNESQGPEFPYNEYYSIPDTDPGVYTLKFNGDDSLDGSIFTQGVIEAEVPLVVVQVGIQDAGTGSATYANRELILEDLQFPYDEEFDTPKVYRTNSSGIAYIRGFGPGHWKVRAYTDPYSSEEPYVQTNKVEINGVNFLKSDYVNTNLNVVPLYKAGREERPLNIADIVRFSQTLETNHFDFNQDGIYNIQDYLYLMNLIRPRMFYEIGE